MGTIPTSARRPGSIPLLLPSLDWPPGSLPAVLPCPADLQRPVLFSHDRCYGCGACLPVCPHGLIEGSRGRILSASNAWAAAVARPPPKAVENSQPALVVARAFAKAPAAGGRLPAEPAAAL